MERPSWTWCKSCFNFSCTHKNILKLNLIPLLKNKILTHFKININKASY